MKNFIESGKQIVVTSAGAKVAGVPIVIGGLVGIPISDAAANTPVTCTLEGVYTLDKATGQAWTQGVALYWDAANKKCTTAAGSDPANTPIGHAFEAAASADTSGIVRLKN